MCTYTLHHNTPGTVRSLTNSDIPSQPLHVHTIATVHSRPKYCEGTCSLHFAPPSHMILIAYTIIHIPSIQRVPAPSEAYRIWWPTSSARANMSFLVYTCHLVLVAPISTCHTHMSARMLCHHRHRFWGGGGAVRNIMRRRTLNLNIVWSRSRKNTYNSADGVDGAHVGSRHSRGSDTAILVYDHLSLLSRTSTCRIDSRHACFVAPVTASGGRGGVA